MVRNFFLFRWSWMASVRKTVLNFVLESINAVKWNESNFLSRIRYVFGYEIVCYADMRINQILNAEKRWFIMAKKMDAIFFMIKHTRQYMVVVNTPTVKMKMLKTWKEWTRLRGIKYCRARDDKKMVDCMRCVCSTKIFLFFSRFLYIVFADTHGGPY